MTVTFMMRHTVRLENDEWRCWACDWTGPLTEDSFAWAHEEAYEEHEVEMAWEDPRVEAYFDWAFSIEDGEIDAAEEIERERRERRERAERLHAAIAEVLREKTPLTGWQRDLRRYGLSRGSARWLAYEVLAVIDSMGEAE